MTEPNKPLLQPLVYSAVLSVMIGWVLFVARDVLVPVAYSIIVVYIVLGMTRQMARIPRLGPHLPAALRYTVSAGVILGALWGVALLILGSVSEITGNAARYDQAALGAIQRAAAWAGVETEPTWPQIRQFLVERVGVTRLLGSTAGVMLGIVALLVVVLLYAIFLLIEQRAFDRKIDRLYADPGRSVRLRAVIHAINDRVGNYLALKTLLSVGLGIVTWAVMAWMNLGFAGLSGLLAGLLNYIPYAGSVLGVVVPALLAVLTGADASAVFWLCVILTTAQFLNGNILDPYLMGNSLNLSPFVILFSLAAWGTLWGIPGALLAVPFAAIMVIVFQEFEGTRPLAVLLSLDGRLEAKDE
ncbi:AI-2E family transporter [Rivibacter subsaxonicus]|uniref:Putative PurR-regulated permease PerM n=1 Tax=Rivibacter subsaxonicus TaxID=457575 RepID=A0A4Q7VMY4_9BURK|nr:AI-2E family transporter [Rivibacter subsaxonicus]RZT97700.1 putative PurR-regulated permease PerM [Rivibacter subsaxonicus]